MIKEKPINVLDLLQARQLSTAPPHFEYIDIPVTYNLEDTLIKWIKSHLKNRFYVGKKLTLSKQNDKTVCLSIGFEDNKEMSYFMLACPHLKYN